MSGKVTNLVLAEKIENLSKYLHERNDTQDKRLDKYSIKIDKNAIGIAGIKGASGVIALAVSIVTTLFGVYFGTKQ